MKISVKKAAPDVYALRFDDVEVALETGDIKTLLLEITRLLAPPGEVMRSAEDRTREFVRHIKNANDVGLQKFILLAQHDDLLVLLNAAAGDRALLDKFHANMSPRLRKMCEEDLAFRFREGLSGAETVAALGRLMTVANDLETEGTLVYQNVIRR